jgi:hypothetical protein
MLFNQTGFPMRNLKISSRSAGGRWLRVDPETS